MGTIVFKQEVGTYIPVNNAHIKQITEKNTEIQVHTASALQKYNQALVPCSGAAFEELMSAK